MYKKGTKIIASMLVFMLTITHLSVIGEVFATSLEDQSVQTNNANVEFDSYFTNENQKTHSAIKTIGEENYLYTQINVKNAGYLKNAVVTLSSANFEIMETAENNQISKIEENKIYYNQIKSGNSVEVALPIQIPYSEEVALEQFNKENSIKLTATYVDGNGKEKQIEKEVIVSLAWTSQKQAELNMQVSKFVPYSINENKGVVLQTLVQSYLKDNTLPVKENKIEISVPTINGIKPQEVKVSANTTKATNGDETGVNFANTNYEYNAEENKLNIIVTNQANEQGKVSWKKQAQDEFVVTYIYSEEALNTIPEEGIQVTINANSSLTTYGASEESLTKTFSGQVTLKDQINNLVDFTISTATTSISKGQIYANYDAQNKIETQYSETITANVGMPELTDKIILEQNADNFVTENNEKVAAQTYYKTITINKNEFNKLLGEEGEICFYVGSTQIAKIDKQTQANEQGKLVVDLSELNINSLKIETSKPQTEGKLNIDIVKAIKGEIEYSKLEMRSFKSIELNLAAKAINGETEFASQTLAKEIPFTEPTSQAELVIDNSNLSTVVTNENVKITAILKTDSLDCMLYKNPTLQITLPSYIENINIKNIEVLFDTENSKLTFKSHQIVQNTDGTKTIIIELEGTQTEYTLGAVSKGVNVVITSDIIVNKFTSNKQDQIKMVYTNSNVISNARIRTMAVAETNEVAAETNEVAAAINVVAPVGVITTSTISNYAENAENITSISGEEKTATISILSEARNANLSMEVINNYNNTIDNISILGRTAFKGNKDILTLEDLGTTINMPLTSNIAVNNVDASKVAIYYSENANATKDVSLASNAWTKTPASLENIKSYLIVLTDYTMNTADRISFNYTMQIPANLQHNESAFENYVVYFNNNLETGTIEDKQASTKVGVTTGTGPVLETSISSNVNETEEVATGKFIKYTIAVKNTGKQVAEDVVAVVNLPEYLNLIEFLEGESGQYTTDYQSTNYTWNVGIINPNETLTKSFWIVVGSMNVEDICKDETHYQEYEGKKYHKSDIKHTTEDYKTTAELKVVVSAKDLAKNLESEVVRNNVKKAYFSISTGTTANGLETLNRDDEFKFNVTVSLLDSTKTANNTIVKVEIPSGLEYMNAQISKFNEEKAEYEIITDGINYDKNTRLLTINLGDVTYQDNREIQITSKVSELPENEYIRIITSIAKVSADGITEETSNPILDTIAKEGIKISQTSNVPENNSLSAGEKLTYILFIENIGGNTTSDLIITDKLSKELQYVDTEYIISGVSKKISNIDDNNTTKLTITIPKGETAEIRINTIVGESQEQVTISNSMKISSKSLGEKESNTIKHIIEKVDYEVIDGEQTTLRKISGQVWKDENNNGIKEENEAKLENVEVMLFNNQTAKLVTDSNGIVLKEKTDKDGNYTFKSLNTGSYTVIFLYDTSNYSATSYRTSNANAENNSDAVDSKITLDGVTRVAAITEEVKITDSNIYNIDLGLVSNPKFDLKLDKTVTSITIQDSNGTSKYEYKDTKLAKKDLVGKEINNTTIIVEYKIKVTNEGAISGFVKKIADYMPTEMKFNSELNKDWYTSENGVLYNSSLANTIINPGESKEVTLILTKKMTENNLGLYNNTAEIYEAYNDLGIEDVDSTAGNKMSNEDDISSADVLITVKTGETILFVGLSISIILTIGIGAYFIKKKVLR